MESEATITNSETNKTFPSTKEVNYVTQFNSEPPRKHTNSRIYREKITDLQVLERRLGLEIITLHKELYHCWIEHTVAGEVAMEFCQVFVVVFAKRCCYISDL